MIEAVQVEHSYDVSPRALFGALTSEDFLAARSARYGGAGEPTVRHSGGAIVVVVPRQLPMEHVPRPAKAFVGDGSVLQVDTWDEIHEDRIAGRWHTDTGRAPIEISGTHEIRQVEGGCRYVVTARVRAPVPVVGGRLAQEVDTRLADLVSRELAFTREWLTSSP